MLSIEFITNMVIGVSIVVGALMIFLVVQIYKSDDNDDSKSSSN